MKILKIYIKTILLTIICSILIAATVKAEEKVEVPEEIREISEELAGLRIGYAMGNPELIQAICWRESRFQEDAEGTGCIGIMQVSGKWHKERMKRLGVTDLKDARQNMTVAVDYLSELVKDGEDMEEALMRYHGESNIEQKLESGEMSDYVEQILEISAMLERQNGK